MKQTKNSVYLVFFHFFFSRSSLSDSVYGMHHFSHSSFSSFGIDPFSVWAVQKWINLTWNRTCMVIFLYQENIFCQFAQQNLKKKQIYRADLLYQLENGNTFVHVMICRNYYYSIYRRWKITRTICWRKFYRRMWRHGLQRMRWIGMTKFASRRNWIYKLNVFPLKFPEKDGENTKNENEHDVSSFNWKGHWNWRLETKNWITRNRRGKFELSSFFSNRIWNGFLHFMCSFLFQYNL